MRWTMISIFVALLVVPAAPAAGRQEPPSSRRAMAALLEEIDRLETEAADLRKQLAEAKLEAAAARRQLEELRQFLHDHEELGRDFQQYQAIKAIAEQESRQRQLEAMRRQREAERAARAEKAREARADQAAEAAEAQRQARYRRAGFTPLGLDVLVGRMAFRYRTNDRTVYDLDFDPFFGFYHIDPERRREIDYSSMTISGTVVNAMEQVRNIGVAITFFDERGNQVGAEIVQINNARPDVPYPFTSTIEMALDRPFSSSSSYVLYADPVGSTPPAAPENPPTKQPQPSS